MKAGSYKTYEHVRRVWCRGADLHAHVLDRFGKIPTPTSESHKPACSIDTHAWDDDQATTSSVGGMQRKKAASWKNSRIHRFTKLTQNLFRLLANINGPQLRRTIFPKMSVLISSIVRTNRRWTHLVELETHRRDPASKTESHGASRVHDH